MMQSIVVSFLFLTKYCLSSAAHWDYDDMIYWADSYPMCDTQDQSPINIQKLNAVSGSQNCNDGAFGWSVDYDKTTYWINNNGHSVSLQAVEETIVDPSLITADETTYMTLGLNDNCIASFPNYFQPQDSVHDEFCLHSMHFHWGADDVTGSEHLVDDTQYPLELHFVHYSCHHSSLTLTLQELYSEDIIKDKLANGEDTHQLGVVGILFEVVDGDTNPAFDRMFGDGHLDNIKHPDATNPFAEIVTDLDLHDLIPANIETAGFYAYEGSLTTPPCTNIVRWHMMNAKGYIGRSQLANFRELMNADHHTIAPNFRTAQANVNTVYACIEEDD